MHVTLGINVLLLYQLTFGLYVKGGVVNRSLEVPILPGITVILERPNPDSTDVVVDNSALNGRDSNTGSITNTTVNVLTVNGTETNDAAVYYPIACSAENAQVLLRGKCETVFSVAQCAKGEYLLLDEERPHCAKRPCPPGQVHFRGKCADVLDESLCPDGQMVYVDFNGESYCDCKPGYFYHKDTDSCFTEHDRGFCSFGEYLEGTGRETYPEDSSENLVEGSSGRYKCVQNPCKYENWVFYPVSHKCLKKDFRGRCDDSERNLLVPIGEGLVTCSGPSVRSIFEVPALTTCPGGSKRDVAGECRRTIKNIGATWYRVPVFHYLRFSCPVGYKRYPSGECKKRNDIFG